MEPGHTYYSHLLDHNRSSELKTIWMDTQIFRVHSLQDRVREVINLLLSKDLVTLHVQGRESTGKSTLARDIIHMVHTLAKDVRIEPTDDPELQRQKEKMKRGFVYRKLQASDIKRLGQIIEELPDSKNKLILVDDASFFKISNPDKHNLSIIRHFSNNDQNLHLIIYVSHYAKALDKFIRQSDVTVFTSISHEEIKPLQQIFVSHPKKIRDFNRRHSQMLQKRETWFKVRNTSLKYVHSSPFRLALWCSGAEMRYTVFPSNSSLGVNSCSLCFDHKRSKNYDYNALLDFLAGRFSPAYIANAVNTLSLEYYQKSMYDRKNISEVTSILKRLISKNIIQIDDLLMSYYKIDNDELDARKSRRRNIAKKHRESYALTLGFDHLGADGAPILDLSQLRKDHERSQEELK